MHLIMPFTHLPNKNLYRKDNWGFMTEVDMKVRECKLCMVHYHTCTHTNLSTHTLMHQLNTHTYTHHTHMHTPHTHHTHTYTHTQGAPIEKKVLPEKESFYTTSIPATTNRIIGGRINSPLNRQVFQVELSMAKRKMKTDMVNYYSNSC